MSVCFQFLLVFLALSIWSCQGKKPWESTRFSSRGSDEAFSKSHGPTTFRFHKGGDPSVRHHHIEGHHPIRTHTPISAGSHVSGRRFPR
ncbi:hypothetical protein V3C99_011941 [Haemonchus contortus]